MGIKKKPHDIGIEEIASIGFRLKAMGVDCDALAKAIGFLGETKILAENVPTLRDAVEDVRRGINKLDAAYKQLKVQKEIEASAPKEPPKRKKKSDA